MPFADDFLSFIQSCSTNEIFYFDRSIGLNRISAQSSNTIASEGGWKCLGRINYVLRILHVTTIIVHRVNGSPSYPEMQLHTGLCLTTLHKAFSPHLPIHGSTQRSFKHALLLAHSAFDVHSGRQFGGRPK